MLQRVQKLLSNYGYCSRRQAEKLIEEGKVKVNNKIISLGDKASETDKIYVDGKLVAQEKKVYLIFNKPVGCITAVKDPRFKTVMDYIKIKERVFPVGRLDYNTSGLLILTNDGDFANKIMHPRYEIKKTYFVKLNEPVAKQDIISLKKGIKLEDGITSPAEITNIFANNLEITIHEGKKRIVRRMFKALGYYVLFLTRIKIGNLKLGNLKPGKYRPLSKEEIQKIFN